jgi:Uma2 family endonuclease
MAIPVVHRISAEEYLSRDRIARHKSEYWHGEVSAMSGVTENHALICTNLTIYVGARLRDSSYDVFGSDMKVGVTKKRGFAYPDLTVTCGERKFFDQVRDVLMNPVAIFEVLSDGTRDFDLGRKFREYKRLESLKHYVTIEQRFREVGHSERQADGSWRSEDFTAEGDIIRLNSIGIEFPLDEIYRRIALLPSEDYSLEYESCRYHCGIPLLGIAVDIEYLAILHPVGPVVYT